VSLRQPDNGRMVNTKDSPHKAGYDHPVAKQVQVVEEYSSSQIYFAQMTHSINNAITNKLEEMSRYIQFFHKLREK
jgi:hypothetical protein